MGVEFTILFLSLKCLTSSEISFLNGENRVCFTDFVKFNLMAVYPN